MVWLKIPVSVTTMKMVQLPLKNGRFCCYKNVWKWPQHSLKILTDVARIAVARLAALLAVITTSSYPPPPDVKGG